MSEVRARGVTEWWSNDDLKSVLWGLIYLSGNMLILSPQNQCLLKSSVILPSWKPFSFSKVEKKILTSWNPYKYGITIKYPHKKKLQRLIKPLELLFLCPNKESDSIFIIMTSTLIGKWHHNHRNDTSATSILCQKDVNRGIFLCDRIEIRIRAVIFDENDTIIRKMLIFGQMWLLTYSIYMTKSGGAKCRKDTNPMKLHTA